MRKYLFAAVAAAAIMSSPAMARDKSFYAGIEAGVMWPGDAEGNAVVDFTTTRFPATPVSPLLPTGTREISNALGYDFNMGYDIDIIGGYDFGMFRLEGELGYKHAKRDDLQIENDFVSDPDFILGDIDFVDADTDNTDGKIGVWSAMLNALIDFGDEDGFSFYAGGGLGWASVKALDDKDSALAWQLIVGARYAISRNIDIGLKYRYFQTGNLDLSGGQAFSRAGTPRAVLVGPAPGTVVFQQTSAGVSPTIDDKFTSHSLLASLIFNFGSPAAAPPPPPPPIMATKAIDAPARKKAKTTASRRIRKIFGNIHEIGEMPNLIEVQRESYEQFLRSDPKKGYVSGLEKTLRSVFPIQDFAGTAHLDFDHYVLEEPKFDTDECRQRGLTYAAPMRVTLRLTTFEIDPETEAKSVIDIKEQDVYMSTRTKRRPPSPPNNF